MSHTTTPPNKKPNFTTREAAAFLEEIGTPFSAGTLEVWRCHGKGPEFRRIGRKIFYPIEALLRFAEGQTVKTCDSI